MRAPEVFLRGPNSRAFILFPRKNAAVGYEGACLRNRKGAQGETQFPPV